MGMDVCLPAKQLPLPPEESCTMKYVRT